MVTLRYDNAKVGTMSSRGRCQTFSLGVLPSFSSLPSYNLARGSGELPAWSGAEPQTHFGIFRPGDNIFFVPLVVIEVNLY